MLSPQLALVTACDTNATPSSAASFTCSAPTTPDVQVDTVRLMTPVESSSGHRRRLSHDSGACELEDVTRCGVIDSLSSPTIGDCRQMMSLLAVTPLDNVTTDVIDDVSVAAAATLSCVTQSTLSL